MTPTLAPTPGAWTFTPPERLVTRPEPGDRYLRVLGVLLLGYAIGGRGFAYLGIPPLFVGEMVLAAGLAVVVLARRPLRLALTPSMWVLAALGGWVVVRVVPGVMTYGVDAVRDAMVVGYGLFAFIVAGLVLERPERLADMLRRYRAVVVGVLLFTWGLYLAVRLSPDSFPTWPWSNEVHIVENKPGDVLVHLAGVTAFLVLGFKRATLPWLAILVVAVPAMMVGGRGGMMAYLLTMGVFWLMKPASARFGRILYLGAVFVVVGVAVDTSGIEVNEGSRRLSVEQVWENVQSLFGKSDSFALNTTTEWRLAWWGKIVGYTFGGEYFLEGKGFGINLASDDGFRVDEEESLRSPHNGHLTLLARGGVPAFLLWLLVHGLWLWETIAAWGRARRAGQTAWVGFFAFAMVYALGALINASFDVYLEGPMGAIWFWTVFGATAAGTRLQRTHPHLLDGLLPSTAAEAEPPRFSWGPPREAPVSAA